MSAFVVEPDTINRILDFLRTKELQSQHVGKEAARQLDKVEFDLVNDPDSLGQAMYNMNINAVSQRYPDSDLSDCPGTHSPKGGLVKYRYKYIENTVNQFQALKSLRCWLYQCSEGNVPETKLYQAFKKIQHVLESDIIDNIPEYEAAQWE